MGEGSTVDDRQAARFVTQALTMLEGFDAGFDEECLRCKDQILDLLRDHSAPLARTSYVPGHVTASAILLSPDGQSVALVHHNKLDRWLQPGGHVEIQDADVLETAKREAREECGVELDEALSPRLLSVDVHEIPAHGEEPMHWHHDFMFLLRAADAELGCSEESAEVRWVALGDLPAYALDACTTRGLARAIGD